MDPYRFATRATLPWDATTRDIILRRELPTGDLSTSRDAGAPHANIRQRVIFHSPCGFEWGYSGSGPADLALNILTIFRPPPAEGPDDERMWAGRSSKFAFKHHQQFKRDFLESLPIEGGIIRGVLIEEWCRDRDADDLAESAAVPGENETPTRRKGK